MVKAFLYYKENTKISYFQIESNKKGRYSQSIFPFLIV